MAQINTPVISSQFLPLNPSGGSIHWNLEKTKKDLVMILHQCIKNYDHMMMICHRDMAWDKQRGYFGTIFVLLPSGVSSN